MSTDVLVKKLNREVSGLREELRRVRTEFLSALTDPEGAYRNAFVKKIREREREGARYRFAGKAAFLRHVRSK